MKIKKETPHLFIRLNNYENYDFIEEHRKSLEKNGHVWILKIGKTMNRDYIDKVIKENGGLIIKSTKSKGNQFYYCKVISADPNSETELKYPSYYDEYLYYEGYDIEQLKKNAYWFKIVSMIPIEYSTVDKFVVGKFNKKLTGLALETRVVHMYTKNREEITI